LQAKDATNNATLKHGEERPPGAVAKVSASGWRTRRMGIMTESRPPVPPFTFETAIQKVQAAEDAWNTRDPDHVSRGYSLDSHRRNRSEHIVGRDEIVAFLTRKRQRELDCSPRKCLWDFHDNRIAVRFQYECRDHTGQWYRSYGNELWDFTPSGLNSRREASINDAPIAESERCCFRPCPASAHGQDVPLW
jgi:nuclear transport factor 2 (NTF2) superfamily protein